MGHNKLNGGKIYINLSDHDIDMASIYVDFGSGNHDAKVGNCLFNLDAKRSISGIPYICVKKLNTDVESIHSDASSKFLEAWSANRLCTPGIWAAEI